MWDTASAGSPKPSLACTPFTFDFALIPVAKYKTDPCWDSQLADIPSSLDSMRYISLLENSVTLQSSSWRVPPLPLNHASKITNFTIKSESLFRVFVSENVIDIDVHLHSISKDGTIKEIAAGAGQFGEESFVAVLQPGSYYVRWEFYNWGSNHPTCSKFSMQLAIAPLTVLPPREQHCPASSVEVSNS